MANNKTIPLANEVLRYFLVPGSAAPARPVNLYMALHTGNPGETGAATSEVSAGLNYARQLITFAVEALGVTQNNNTPSFGAASAPWGTLNYFSICLSNVVGTADLKYYGPLTTPRAVGTGQSYNVAAGAIVVSEE